MSYTGEVITITYIFPCSASKIVLRFKLTI